MDAKELTDEEKAEQAAKEQQELLARCKEERRVAKEAICWPAMPHASRHWAASSSQARRWSSTTTG